MLRFLCGHPAVRRTLI